MTKPTDKTKQNGARPPDLESMPTDDKRRTIRQRVEHLLSDADTHGLSQIVEISGAKEKTAHTATSRAVQTMVKEGLVTELRNPDDLRRKLFRWSYFEEQEPTPPEPGIPDFMLMSPDQMFVDGPPGWRTRLSRQWYRIADNGKVRIERPSVPMGDLTDAEVQIFFEDVCLNNGAMQRQFTGAPGRSKGGPISGHELLMRSNAAGGVSAPGMRSAVGSWIGAVRDSFPMALWLPECLIQSRGGWRIHPSVVHMLRVNISAVPSLFPRGPWACPAEIVRATTAEAANIWRSKSFVGQ